MVPPSREAVQALIEELESLDKAYWAEDEADPGGADEAARKYTEKSDRILACLRDYIKRWPVEAVPSVGVLGHVPAVGTDDPGWQDRRIHQSSCSCGWAGNVDVTYREATEELRVHNESAGGRPSGLGTTDTKV